MFNAQASSAVLCSMYWKTVRLKLTRNYRYDGNDPKFSPSHGINNILTLHKNTAKFLPVRYRGKYRGFTSFPLSCHSLPWIFERDGAGNSIDTGGGRLLTENDPKCVSTVLLGRWLLITLQYSQVRLYEHESVNCDDNTSIVSIYVVGRHRKWSCGLSTVCRETRTSKTLSTMTRSPCWPTLMVTWLKTRYRDCTTSEPASRRR